MSPVARRAAPVYCVYDEEEFFSGLALPPAVPSGATVRRARPFALGVVSAALATWLVVSVAAGRTSGPQAGSEPRRSARAAAVPGAVVTATLVRPRAVVMPTPRIKLRAPRHGARDSRRRRARAAPSHRRWLATRGRLLPTASAGETQTLAPTRRPATAQSAPTPSPPRTAPPRGASSAAQFGFEQGST